MTDDQRCSVALVGLPSAGKSTYIAALFQACVAQRDGLEITHLGDGQRDYLNKLGRQLADFNSLTRTQQSEPGELSLTVKLSAEGEPLRLVIPDLSGEHLRDALGGTQPLFSELHDLLVDVGSVLVFVRTDRVASAETLVDLNALLEGVADPDEADTAPERPEDWVPEMAPTQVRLAHALQELVRLRGDRAVRVAIVLSAWDQAESSSPETWARGNLALVTQLLDNEPSIAWTAFGASSQGGDFKNPEDRARLEQLKLSERAQVYDGLGDPVSISAPIAWSLSLSQ